jgi:beta-D-galactosyl-(1->4)-L-rhamnose phosphorylase
VLGVDREIGRTLSHEKRIYEKDAAHFIMADVATYVAGAVDLGKDVDNVFVVSGDTQVLADRDRSPRVAAHRFRAGRAVYLSGYKFTPQNTRLLHRALYWAAGVEGDFGYWICSSIHTECAYYPASNKLVVINNGDRDEETTVFDADRNGIDVSVEPFGIEIIDL